MNSFSWFSDKSVCVHIQSSIHLFAYSTHKITLELCMDKWFIVVASVKTGYSGTGVVGWFFKNINPLVPMGFCAMWMHWLLKSQFWIFKKEFETEPRKTCKLFRTDHCWGDCTNSVCLVQFSSVTQSHPTLCSPMNCSVPGFPVHHQLFWWCLLKLMSIESVMPSSHLILCIRGVRAFCWSV